MAPKREPRAPRGRTDAAERILVAARDLFTERGFDGVSIRDIAGRSGVSKANVFHHFTSKAALYDEVLDDARMIFDRLITHLDDAQAPFAVRLERFATAHLEQMLDDPASVNLFLRQMLAPAGNHERGQAEATIATGMHGLLERLEQGMAEDGIAAGDGQRALTLALTILGGTFMYFQLRDVMPRLEDCTTGYGPRRYGAALVGLLDGRRREPGQA